MNRRDVFKLFVAGVVSLLGMKGLAETLSRPKAFGSYYERLTPSEVNSILGISEPVMGEQAHWRQEDTDRLLESMAQGHPETIRVGNAKVAAAKIDGEWVDTSDWSPEQIQQRLQPRPFKRRHV